MSEKNIHGGHRKRLRDRAMAEGLDSFDPHQVLELLLFYALPRQDTSEIAHRLINRFGSVRGALTAPTDELVQIQGVGKKVAEWLHDVEQLVNTYTQLEAGDKPSIKNLKTAFEFCEEQQKRCRVNTTYQVCTTPSGRIQVFTQICDSLEWGDQAVLRSALHEALAVKARNILILEFVEEDTPKVYEYDQECAEKYAYTLSTIGAELLDVILVGRRDVLSLYRSGHYEREKFCNARSVVSANYLREELWDPYADDELPDYDSGL